MYSISVLYHNCNSSMASEKATLFCYRHAATTGLTTCMAVNFIIRSISVSFPHCYYIVIMSLLTLNDSGYCVTSK